MTEGKNGEHLSGAMTTESAIVRVNDVTQTTVAPVVTSSRDIEFYYQCAVVVIGLVGTAANALILYAMVASKEHKKHKLIFHQNVLDFVSSLLLVITYALKLCNFYLTGLGGYWFCMLILSENFNWCAILASKANLVFVTIDRYLKVVRPAWTKKNARKWMVYSAMALTWISGFAHAWGLTFPTSQVIDGVCYAYVTWRSRVSQMAYGIFYFLSFYIFILATFIFCYWRILVAIRHQAKVMAGHAAAGPSTCTSQTQSNQIQSNIIKTMILVSTFYAISDLPMNVYYLLLNINANLTMLQSGYYAVLFISFLYICTNPFIYAMKFNPVKRVLLSMIPCKNTVQAAEGIEVNSFPPRHPQTHN